MIELKNSKDKKDKAVTEMDMAGFLKSLQAFSKSLGELNDYVKYFAARAEELLGEDEEDEEEEIEDDPMAMVVYPQKRAVMIPFDSCFDRFSWFGESEESEPVPGAEHFFMIYDPAESMDFGDSVIVRGPVVIYRVDEDGEICSLTTEEMLWMCEIFKGLSCEVYDRSEDKKFQAFSFE